MPNDFHSTGGKLKSGFIFIPDEKNHIPSGYAFWHLGAKGYVGQLDQTNINGWEMISRKDYFSK